MLPVLEIASKGETSVPLAADAVADRIGLSQSERDELLPSGKQRLLHNRIHWAKFYLSKAGFLESPRRGRFVISASGRKLLSNPPERLDTKYLLSVPAFRDFYKSEQADEFEEAASQTDTSKSTPEEIVEGAYKATRAALQAELLDRILQNSPTFFEGLIVDLLVAMGYGGSHRNAATQLGRSGDGGVDGVINEDILGLDRVYVQARRYGAGSSVGRPEVQAFIGSLVGLGASKGVFVTTSTFSTQAVEFVSRIPQRVILIDRRRLTELMIDHGVGVRSSRIIEFNRLDEDFFSEE
ncbi:MAG: restriction endonuclease [Bradyrhizobium sp.]